VKKSFALISAVLTYLSFAPSAFAQIINCANIQEPFKKLCKSTTTDIPGIIGAAITFIFVIAVVIALFFLAWGAVRWILSGGDKAAVEAARGQIVASVVGLVILFFAFLVFNIVLFFFDVDIGNLNIPKIPTTPIPITP
jgi:hypothetical protein